jgi:hypothetical protein
LQLLTTCEPLSSKSVSNITPSDNSKSQRASGLVRSML